MIYLYYRLSLAFLRFVARHCSASLVGKAAIYILTH